jgi:hypothetical protein
MKKISVSQIVTISLAILTITVNTLANALPINGQNTGEISDRFDIYFVPAGYVFSIWGLIYIGMIAYTIYQALPAQRDSELVKKINPSFWISNIANTAWIFLWHYEFFPLTLVTMLTLLASLLYIYLQVSERTIRLDKNQKWFAKYPFSIYLGWISVATIANISQVLFYIGWNSWGISPLTWTVIMIAVATMLGLLILWRENDILYVLVLVWSFVGIANSQAGTALVANTAYGSGAILTLGIIITAFMGRNPSVKE